MTDLSKFRQRIIVTGGAGFIGANFLLYMVPKYPDYLFINIDCLTYAGNLISLLKISNSSNYIFERVNISDYNKLKDLNDKYKPTGVVHLAAESHVDRSIIGPSDFIETNIIGTFNLLELARSKTDLPFRFHHVSTDEVFGSLGSAGYFNEDTRYHPNSPYSASKAAGDHLVRSYHKTYGLDTVTTNCSNNYGPYQFPEKLIPLMIRNAIENKPLPIYGDGKHIRDWLYVEDHCRALDLVYHIGKSGETYNIGGSNEIENLKLVKMICSIIDSKIGGNKRESLITFVEDRLGHDRRYAIDASKIKNELGWQPEYEFEKGLNKTIEWYLENKVWLEACISGEYLEYYNKIYNKQ
jgi:dTDP-glucose 4,6-dehydratase